MATAVPTIPVPAPSFPTPPVLSDPLAPVGPASPAPAVILQPEPTTATGPIFGMTLRDLVVLASLIVFSLFFSFAWIILGDSAAEVPAISCLGVLLGNHVVSTVATAKAS
jgi:hypothetical protein